MEVKFDGVSIITSPYHPEFIGHESSPERALSILNLAREDGAVIIADRYNSKRIIISGILTGSNQDDLEIKIDAFKELFGRLEKNLDIEWNGSTRRYKATCENHNFDRKYYMTKFVPWTAQFIVPQGIGEDISETILFENIPITGSIITGPATFQGSAKPRPRFRIRCSTTASSPRGLSIENIDNNERIVITRFYGFGANKNFEIDCRNKTVKYDGEIIPFYGVFPKFEIGTNNVEIKIAEILDQAYELPLSWGSTGSVYTNVKRAQSFTVPYKDGTYQTIELLLSRSGIPTSNLQIEIQTDDGGKPSGIAVPNASFLIPGAGIGASLAWHKANSANPFALEANTRYWIVPNATGSSGNCYNWAMDDTSASYKRGNSSYTSDNGATWDDEPDVDLAFRLRYGGIIDPAKTYNLDIYYYKRYL